MSGAEQGDRGEHGFAVGVLVGGRGDAGDGGVGDATAGGFLRAEQRALVGGESAAGAGEQEEGAGILDAAQVGLTRLRRRRGRPGGLCGVGVGRWRQGGDEAVEDFAGLARGCGAGVGEHQVDPGGSPGIGLLVHRLAPVASLLGVAEDERGAREGLGIGLRLLGSALMASDSAAAARRKSLGVSADFSAAA